MDSIISDVLVVQALQQSEVVVGIVDDHIYNPARPEADEAEDHVPYIVVTLQSMRNINAYKDDIEGATDEESVSLLCVAESREVLSSLVNAARQAVRRYILDLDTPVYLSTVSASAVVLDPLKPCVYQTLNYTFDCEYNPD